MTDFNIFWSFYGIYALTSTITIYWAHYRMYVRGSVSKKWKGWSSKAISAFLIALIIGVVFFVARVVVGEDTSEPAWLIFVGMFATFAMTSMTWDVMGKALTKDIDKHIEKNGVLKSLIPAAKIIGGRAIHFDATRYSYPDTDPGIAPENEAHQ